MDFSELLGIVLVAELLSSELLARQVEYTVADNVVAVIIAAGTLYPVNFSSKNIPW